MKNIYLFLIFIFLSMQPGYSQKVLYEEQGESFTLSSYLIPYNSYKYTATQNIKLTDSENSSFKYSPMPGQSFQAEINPFQVLPPEAGEVGGPNPNDDGVVGTIPGSAFVGSSGAASYQIPIEALPGINGMTPNLSLIYNSNSGNGLLGMGWMIGGMSVIQRTGTNIYHEGYVDGVDFDDNDKLMLNGNRLISVGDNEYRTEIETFSKIEAMNIVNGWPQWFRVYTKSGHIYEYGNSEDSRIQAPGRNDVMSWIVNKISDRTGNYIKFQYVEEHGMARISTIEYADDGSGAVNSMNFYYSGGRIDNIKYYRAGCEFMLNVLLDSIQVNFMQTNVRTYVMEYNTHEMYSRLTAIRLWDEGRAKHFNPTTFEWGESKLAFDSEPSNITNNSEADIVTGDFNGDGKTDVATAFYTISDDSQRDKEFTTWSVYFSNSSHGTSFERLDIGDLPGGFSHFVVIDYNGDGLDDLVQILSNSYNYLESTGTGFSAPVYGGYHIGNVENHCEFAPVDLNGNGIGDLLLISKSNNGKAFNYRIDAFEFDGNDFISIIFDPSGQQGFSWSSPAEYLEILPGDFNGDGKTELLIEIQNNNCTVYGLNETGNILEVVYSDVFNIPISSMALKTLTGDINGDGITDLVTVSYDDPPILTIRLLNGQDGWSDLNADISFPASNHLEKYDFYYNYIVADFNGDSKSDVLLGYTEYKRDHASDPWELVGRHWDTYYSNGTGVVKEPNFI